MNNDYFVKSGMCGMPWYGALFSGSETQPTVGIFLAHRIPSGKPLKKYPK